LPLFGGLVYSVPYLYICTCPLNRSLGLQITYQEVLNLKPAAIKKFCQGLDTLTEKQQEICSHSISVVKVISRGAKLGIEECQYQFKNERWNCSTYHDHPKVFGGVIESSKLFLFVIN
jgi:protein wnt